MGTSFQELHLQQIVLEASIGTGKTSMVLVFLRKEFKIQGAAQY